MIKKYFKSILSLVLLFISCVSFANQDYELEKVVILSRHGLRSPLTGAGSKLSAVTPHTWKQWDVPSSYLTKKGAMLEVYFGQYINEWLMEKNVLEPKKCLMPSEVLIYTNSLPRTIATGQALTLGIFPGCDIYYEHRVEIGKMDPTFNPIIRTDDVKFKQTALKVMNLKSMNKQLEKSYKLLESVIDYKNSKECKENKNCVLYNEEGKIMIEKDKEPGVSGPIRLSTQIVDALLLQYYEGYNFNLSKDKWLSINKIKDAYGELLFGSKYASKHIAKPLINFIKDDLINSNHKVTILVGHDSNVVSLLSALEFKEYKLDDQFEKTPIGGKIFFEVYKNKTNGSRKVKVEYVYQTVDQIRNLEKLTKQNPPKHTILEMKNCKIDKNGLCDYDKFIENLNKQ